MHCVLGKRQTLRYLASGNIAAVDPKSIFIYGRSLGGAVGNIVLRVFFFFVQSSIVRCCCATHVVSVPGIWCASNFPEWLSGIIVENAFTSVPAMVDVVLPALKYVKFLSRNTW